MSYVLDTKSTDSYQELPCPGTHAVTVQVSNAAVLLGFGGGDGRKWGATYPAADEPFLPAVGSLARSCDAIRVKSYTPGVPADVKIIAQ
jgi:hypothetical protein